MAADRRQCKARLAAAEQTKNKTDKMTRNKKAKTKKVFVGQLVYREFRSRSSSHLCLSVCHSLPVCLSVCVCVFVSVCVSLCYANMQVLLLGCKALVLNTFNQFVPLAVPVYYLSSRSFSLP